MTRKYTAETTEVILQRMLDASDPDIDSREGSITHDFSAKTAYEVALAYFELDNTLELVFADSSNGEWLTRRCAEMDVNRKPAVKAVVQLTFTGTPGQVIVAGSRASTDSVEPVYFVTKQDGTMGVDGTITIEAEAEIGGDLGNVGPNTIILVAGNIAGVTAVTNVQEASGGVDEESDADLLARYLERIRRPATSGNANHYLQWAKEVPGVGDARVIETWNGGGTVKVIVIDSERTNPTPELVTQVEDYIESVRPVNVAVTVVGATDAPMNIAATLVLAPDKTAEDAKSEFEPLAQAYLKTLAFVDPIVRYNELGKLILDCPSVIDYSGFTLNGATANILIDNDEVAVLGTVTFS